MIFFFGSDIKAPFNLKTNTQKKKKKMKKKKLTGSIIYSSFYGSLLRSLRQDNHIKQQTKRASHFSRVCKMFPV